MVVESTRADLLAIEQAHQSVYDRGYRLAATPCDYRAQMPEETVNEWDEVIMDWVRNQSAWFWDVALEVLVRGGRPGVNGELADLLRELGRRSGEWRECVVNTLIRR